MRHNRRDVLVTNGFHGSNNGVEKTISISWHCPQRNPIRGLAKGGYGGRPLRRGLQAAIWALDRLLGRLLNNSKGLRSKTERLGIMHCSLLRATGGGQQPVLIALFWRRGLNHETSHITFIRTSGAKPPATLALLDSAPKDGDISKLGLCLNELLDVLIRPLRRRVRQVPIALALVASLAESTAAKLFCTKHKAKRWLGVKQALVKLIPAFLRAG